jgi:hypothetical protein
MANIAALHRSWAVDRTQGQTDGQKNRGQHPTGRKSPNGAQTATQSDMGAVLGESPGHAKMKWRHLVRKPAKLTGTRRELCTWGEPTRT